MPSERYETEWEGLRLVVEGEPHHWQAFVYDPAACEVLYTAERMNVVSAKYAAVAFTAAKQFGPAHNLKSEIIADMLVWELA